MANENETYEEEDYEEEEVDLIKETERTIAYLRRERIKYPMTSQEYMVVTQRIEEETRSLQNLKESRAADANMITAKSNRYAWAWQLGGQVLGNIAGQTISSLMNMRNVDTVVNYEQNGGIVNSKATKFLR